MCIRNYTNPQKGIKSPKAQIGSGEITFERFRHTKEGGSKEKDHANTTGIGARDASSHEGHPIIDVNQQISGIASRFEILGVVAKARGVLIDSFDISTSPQSSYYLYEITKSFDLTAKVFSSHSTVLLSEEIQRVFSVLDYTGQYLVERVGMATSREEMSDLTRIGVAVVQSKSLILAKAASEIKVDRARFVEILNAIQERIRETAKERIRRGEGKQIKSASEVTISAIQKVVKKIQGGNPKQMSLEEEERVTSELFNLKVVLNRPENVGRQPIVNVTEHEIDEILVLVYV